LRQVGAHFHASADGVAAAERAFAVLAQPAPEAGSRPAPDLRSTTVRLRGVSVAAPDRARLAPAGLDLDVPPGAVVALAGPNGAGKSTAVAVLLGLLRPDRGDVVLVPQDGGEIPLREVDARSWWDQIAWVPQRPVLEPGSVRDAVGHGRVPQADLDRAAALTGFDTVVAELPGGWDARIGQGGAGLSVGQRQRLALTRALVAPSALVILDEPTAHLDGAAENQVLAAVSALRAAGRTVLLVAHRPALLAAADVVATVRSEPLSTVAAVSRGAQPGTLAPPPAGGRR